jgi:choline dehydrogenase-like flavoprotein
LHPFAAFTASVCNLRPTSRGSVHAASPDASKPPAISPNYLSTEEDRRVAVDALRLTRKIVAQPPLARFRPEEHRPGAHLTSDQELATAAGEIGTTIFHPVGTAKMGADNDPLAVLDERLRVRGVERLRVIDASAMPRITSGNTNSPTIMIAEKGAAMVLEDQAG